MTKEDAIRATYKNKWMLKYKNPSMVSWDRIMKAMDLYASFDNDSFEVFCDESYYYTWVVRPVGDRNFYSHKLFRFKTKEEAETMKQLLENRI